MRHPHRPTALRRSTRQEDQSIAETLLSLTAGHGESSSAGAPQEEQKQEEQKIEVQFKKRKSPEQKTEFSAKRVKTTHSSSSKKELITVFEFQKLGMDEKSWLEALGDYDFAQKATQYICTKNDGYPNYTLLMVAAQNGWVAATEMLLIAADDSRAYLKQPLNNPELKDKNGLCAPHIALLAGNFM